MAVVYACLDSTKNPGTIVNYWKSGKTKKNYSAPALEKGLDIIELLSETSDGFSQAEIAKELNRSVNEIYRMLNILVSRNYIEFDTNNERKLSFKLLS